jgi:AraC family transcriptional regulator
VRSAGLLKLFIRTTGDSLLAKIAVELQQAVAHHAKIGSPGHITTRPLAKGDGWTVSDVLCTCGPQDRPFEERHTTVSIAAVVAGSFQYRTTTGHDLMPPGSLLLGNAADHFECGHRHGTGDRCISFSYAPDYFERIASDSGRVTRHSFRTPRLPPLRASSPLIAQACANVTGAANLSWEELSIQFAAQTVHLANGLSPAPDAAPPSAAARITKAMRAIEHHPETRLTLASLAREARLSPYHFLRIFQRLTGLTPHQYILRTRLREAAIRLTGDPAKVLDIALDCGFGDISNFNHAFRTEFGVSPRLYRQQTNRKAGPQLR